MLARVELAPEGPPQPLPPPRPVPMFESHPEPELVLAGPGDGSPAAGLDARSAVAPVPITARSLRSEAIDPNDPSTWRNTARNSPCPCGSGKKYKHCHGKLS
jgi:preprotein translocase subunit SecA